ncbi:darcynin family protein [Undibacterium sp.]|uniref:darcynin family protein n=1 Tax=Undibacterium sp. TaxID=1914977 RepID=UPI0025FACF05|nr:darcynin family protein [Undibacterium sp.]MCX7220084.1 hypothetical protein [Burkholderiales bacterium]
MPSAKNKPAAVTPLTIFWLVKATPRWLALAPHGEGGRFAFVDAIIKPILARYPGVQLRFFDAEAYATLCSDVMMWQLSNREEYQALVEALRETNFWDHYFQVLHILPTVEDGYASHYQHSRAQDLAELA